MIILVVDSIFKGLYTYLFLYKVIEVLDKRKKKQLKVTMT